MKTHNKLAAGTIAVLLLLISPFALAAASLKDYEATAAKVVDGLTAHDPAPFNRAIDADSIIETAFDGLYLDSNWKRDFGSGLKKAINTQLGNKLISRIPANAYAKLLRVKVQGNEGRALARLDYGDSGSGYMDMHLVKDASGKIRIVDWYDYSTGQLYSQSLRQAIATLSPTPTVLGKVFDIATNRKAAADVMEKFIGLNNQQKYAETVRYFLSLDEDFRKSRLLNIIAFQAASQIDDMELYRKVLENIEHYYSNDDTMAFVLLDYYYLDGKYGKVLHSANQLMSSFGVDDANLLVIKSNTLIELKKFAEAEKQANRAIALEPDFEYGYWSQIASRVGSKDYGKAVETAKILENKFGYDLSPANFAGNETYAGFIQSAEYISWRKEK